MYAAVKNLVERRNDTSNQAWETHISCSGFSDPPLLKSQKDLSRVSCSMTYLWFDHSYYIEPTASMPWRSSKKKKKTVRTRSVSKHKSSTPPTAVRSQQEAGGSERAQEGAISRGAVQDHRALVCCFSTTRSALTPFSCTNFYLPTKGQMWSKTFLF